MSPRSLALLAAFLFTAPVPAWAASTPVHAWAAYALFIVAAIVVIALLLRDALFDGGEVDQPEPDDASLLAQQARYDFDEAAYKRATDFDAAAYKRATDFDAAASKRATNRRVA